MYALDGTEAEDRPYLVTEHNYTIELLQPAHQPGPDGPQNYHAVFLTHDRETVTAHYERALYPVDGELRADPRITHDVVLAIDDYGNPLRSASAGYGRRLPDPALAPEDQAAQARLRLTYTDNGYTNAVERPDAHRTPMPAQTRAFEVVGLAPAGRLFGFAELRDGLAAISAELPFQDWDADPGRLAAPARRLISRTRCRTGATTCPGRCRRASLSRWRCRTGATARPSPKAWSPTCTAAASTPATLRDGWLPAGGRERGGCRPARCSTPASDGDDPAAELDYARRHFFLPHRFTDPFGNTTTVSYDRYDLLSRQTRTRSATWSPPANAIRPMSSPLDGNDYRVLAPRLVSDPNRNRAAVAFDTLGRVCGTAVMGKPEERLGDSLDGFDPDLAAAAVAAYFADPFGLGTRAARPGDHRVLYDLDAYRRSRGEPAPARPGWRCWPARPMSAIWRPGSGRGSSGRSSYSDGFGREIQRKGQAGARAGHDGGPDVEHRWIGSGWTVFNNKGKPVRAVRAVLHRHPPVRVRARGRRQPGPVLRPGRAASWPRVHPNHTYEKVVFDPWRQETWDVNDTVLLDPANDPDVGEFVRTVGCRASDYLPTWYDQRRRRSARPGGAGGRRPRPRVHASTPAVAYTDALGRAFLTVAHNRFLRDGTPVQDVPHAQALDIQGNQRQSTTRSAARDAPRLRHARARRSIRRAWKRANAGP